MYVRGHNRKNQGERSIEQRRNVMYGETAAVYGQPHHVRKDNNILRYAATDSSVSIKIDSCP